MKREEFKAAWNRLDDMLKADRLGERPLEKEEREAIDLAMIALAERVAYLENMSRRMKSDREILKRAKAAGL